MKKYSRITGRELMAQQCRLTGLAAALHRINSARIGVIAGGPPNTREEHELNTERAVFLQMLAGAGPRLRTQFRAAEWEFNYNADGSVKV